MSLFFFSDFDAAGREKIAAPDGELSSLSSSSSNDYNDEAMVNAFVKIVSIFNHRIRTERHGSYAIPDGTPRGYFTFFDRWQEVVDDCVTLQPANE